jgi:hypothetical protein
MRAKKDQIMAAVIVAANQSIETLVERIKAVMPVKVAGDWIEVDPRVIDSRSYQKEHGLDCVARMFAVVECGGYTGPETEKGWIRLNVLCGNTQHVAAFVGRLEAEKVIPAVALS